MSDVVNINFSGTNFLLMQKVKSRKVFLGGLATSHLKFAVLFSYKLHLDLVRRSLIYFFLHIHFQIQSFFSISLSFYLIHRAMIRTSADVQSTVYVAWALRLTRVIVWNGKIDSIMTNVHPVIESLNCIGLKGQTWMLVPFLLVIKLCISCEKIVISLNVILGQNKWKHLQNFNLKLRDEE